MTTKFKLLAIAFMMALYALTACGHLQGKGDLRERNIEKATFAYLDSVGSIEYVGMSDTHVLADGIFQAVLIYYVTDRNGKKVERNARVTTNDDCSEIYTWENLDCRILEEAKQTVYNKMEENGIKLDDSLIDALIELKKQAR